MIVAATGHRPDKLGGYDLNAAKIVENFARIVLRDEQPDMVISGMALGWDTAIAKAAVALGIPLLAAVPFKGQESKWPYKKQEEYYNLLRAANDIVYVSDPPYSAQKMHIRNEWMVNECDLLLACWDGSASGTYQCIAYARNIQRYKTDLHIKNVWEDFVRYRGGP